MTQPHQINPNDFLMGGGGPPGVKFDGIGVTVTGTIAEIGQLRQQTDFQSGKPLFWEDGNPRMQLPITLQTSQRDDPDDDGQRRIFVRGELQKAIKAAVVNAGAEGLAVGGTLTVTYVGDGVVKTRGMSPPKLYSATYVPPNPTAAFLGTAPQVTTPQVTTPQVTAPNSTASAAGAPAGVGGVTAEQLAAARAALPPEVLAALAAQQ